MDLMFEESADFPGIWAMDKCNILSREELTDLSVKLNNGDVTALEPMMKSTARNFCQHLANFRKKVPRVSDEEREFHRQKMIDMWVAACYKWDPAGAANLNTFVNKGFKLAFLGWYNHQMTAKHQRERDMTDGFAAVAEYEDDEYDYVMPVEEADDTTIVIRDQTEAYMDVMCEGLDEEIRRGFMSKFLDNLTWQEVSDATNQMGEQWWREKFRNARLNNMEALLEVKETMEQETINSNPKLEDSKNI